MRHFIDYEYNHRDNQFMHPVCVSLDDKVYWLDNNEETDKFIEKMKEYEGDEMVAHAASFAEIPMSIVMSINVDKYTWICTESLFKLLSIYKGRSENKTSLLACMNYYNIAHDITSDIKDRCREYILSCDVDAHKDEIIDYCGSDTEDLGKLLDAELKELAKYEQEYTIAEVDLECNFHQKSFKIDEVLKKQSEIHIETAKMYVESFNVDTSYVEHLKDPRFALLIKHQINEIIPGAFRENAVKDDKVIGDWIFSTFPEAEEVWESGERAIYRTPKGSFSFGNEAIKEFCEGRSGVEQLEKVRQLLKLLQASRGLSKEGSANWYYPNTFSDGTHCHANELGAVTTRYGMKASSACIPAWSKALRSALKPKDKNEVYFALDYSAQEMWIIAQLSKDRELLKVYTEEDVYMALATQMGLYVPPVEHPGVPSKKMQKEEWFKPYKPLRSKVKSLNLGMNYGMTPRSFAKKNKLEEPEAKQLFETYDTTFKQKSSFSKRLWDNELTTQKIIDGFTTTVEKRNILIGKELTVQGVSDLSTRSKIRKEQRRFKNFPVQCIGAQITRTAIRLAQSKGLHPFIPMHDEIYFKTTEENLEIDIAIARKCMQIAADHALAFDCLCKEFPIKVGEPEIIRCNDTVIHDGAEQLHEQLMEYFKILDTGDKDENYGFNIKTKKSTKRIRQTEHSSDERTRDSTDNRRNNANKKSSHER